MVKRIVHLGTRNLDGLAGSELVKCQHWAVRVDNCWYEIEGDGKDSRGPNKFKKTRGNIKKITNILLMGATEESDESMDNWYLFS
jgi:hypothetical protein